LNDEIHELRNKKRCLQNDVDAMTASADEYAEKAEKTHQLTWIIIIITPTISNAP